MSVMVPLPVVQMLEFLAGERTTEMLPVLHDIFIDKDKRDISTQKIIKLFLGCTSIHTQCDYPAIKQGMIMETILR